MNIASSLSQYKQNLSYKEVTSFINPDDAPLSKAGKAARDTRVYPGFHCIKGGSPIGFSGSGIWLISRPGFGILKEKEDEMRDCNYDRDTGFGDFNRRESGNVALKKPRFGNSRD